MYKPEFVALQVSVLVRSDELKSRDIEAFMDSVEFKSEMQDKLATLFQESLHTGNVSFDEVIISVDKPPQRAKPIEPTQSSADKPSKLARLFGKK